MAEKKKSGKILIIIFIILSLSLGAILTAPDKAHALSWEQVGQSDFGSDHIRITRFIEFDSKLYTTVQHKSGSDVSSQVWYTSDGENWTQSVGYPSNYTASLFNDTEVFGSYLYVSQSNGTPNTALIYRSSDGVNWSSSVIANGFGDANNIRIMDIKSAGGYLYAVTANLVTGLEVWRSQTGDFGSWSQVVDTGFGDGNNMVAGIETFDSDLYVATTNLVTGAEIWSSSTGDLGSWSQIGVDGIDPINTNYGVNMTVEFNNNIYFLAYEGLSTPRMWRSSDGSTWSQVSSTGLDISFVGDDAAIGTTGLVVNGKLWLGMSHSVNGARLKYSTDGANWTQEGETGFGDTNNNYLHPIIYFSDRLYIGFDNTTSGGEIWRTALSFLTTSLPSGTVGESYCETIQATSGNTPYTFSYTGYLPPGLSLSEDGVISGTPTQQGTYTFTITVTDAGTPAQVDSQDYSIEISLPASQLPETGSNRINYLWILFFGGLSCLIITSCIFSKKIKKQY